MDSKISVFHTNIEDDTIKNNDYRHVIFTGKHEQLVLMSLKPGEDIPEEIHDHLDQFFRIEKGEGEAIVGDDKIKYPLKDGISIIIPAGTKHYIKNTSSTDDLKIYTIYSPPNHPANRIDPRQPKEQDGGSVFKNKYLKYKQKYLGLKYH